MEHTVVNETCDEACKYSKFFAVQHSPKFVSILIQFKEAYTLNVKYGKIKDMMFTLLRMAVCGASVRMTQQTLAPVKIVGTVDLCCLDLIIQERILYLYM